MGSYDLKLMIKAAELYYMEDLPQRDIAQRLNISRPKVSRLLKAARKNNLVEIKINYPELMRSQIEKIFEEKYKLKEAIIVSNEGLNHSRSFLEVTSTAGEYLKSTIKNNDCVGVAWGRTLNAMVDTMGINKIKGVKIVQMIGSLGQNLIDSSEIVRKMAQAFQGEHYLLPAPGFVGSPEIKNAIIQDATIQDALDRARKVDTAVIGIGQINQSYNPFYKSYLTQEDFDLLKEKKIVGDICAHFFDIHGNFNVNLDQRAITIDIEDLKRIPRVVAVATDDEKAQAILGALNTETIDILITDEKTAKQVLHLQETINDLD